MVPVCWAQQSSQDSVLCCKSSNILGTPAAPCCRSGKSTGFAEWSPGFQNAAFFGWQAVPLATGVVALGDELVVVEEGSGAPQVPSVVGA